MHTAPKKKCFSAQPHHTHPHLAAVTHTCKKQNHSCVRRIISWYNTETGWKKLFQNIGKALQLLLCHYNIGVETKHLKQASNDISNLIWHCKRNPPWAKCLYCSNKKPAWAIATADAAQAFEQIQYQEVEECLTWFITQLWHHKHNYVVLHFSKPPRITLQEHYTKLPNSTTISLEQIQSVHLTIVKLNRVAFGETFFEQTGVPIGGTNSKVLLSLVAGVQEVRHWQNYHNHPPHKFPFKNATRGHFCQNQVCRRHTCTLKPIMPHMPQ